MKYFAILLLLIVLSGVFTPVFGYKIHNLDYENSPYQNKKTPSLGVPVELFYQITNYTPKSQVYDLLITITNMDEKKQVYSEQYNHKVSPDRSVDILWKFTPESSGLYVVEAVETPYKYTRYVFAVPETNDFKKIHKTDPEFLEDHSPRQQFRMGIDPKEIFCKDELYLAQKSSGLPACITLDTLVELRHRDLIIPEIIDYDRIGYTISENQFVKMLEEKNITYDGNNLLLILGMSLTSLPPINSYCGYVVDNTENDYWFSTTYKFHELANSEIHDKNPHPCDGVMDFTCECTIQKQLLEKDLTELSYFDEFQEKHVGQAFRDFLNEGGKVANVPNSFIVGKYNMNLDSDATLFCGQFQGKMYWHFIGMLNGTEIPEWGLESDERPKLCAINDNPTSFTFDESAIAKQQ